MRNEVTFKEDTHQYFNDKGEEYISCTTLIGKYIPKFDVDIMASKTAFKNNKKTEEVKQEWQINNKFSTDYGTMIHKGIEGCIKHIPEYYENENKDIVKSGYEKICKYIGEENINSEMLLWNHNYKIAGQSDIVQFTSKTVYIDHQRTSINIINIGDIKTNKSFEFYSKYNNYMLYPVNHLMACHFNDYTLQLSLYAFMLQELYPTFHIGTLFLMHYDRNKNIWTKINLPYMKYEVMALLKHYQINQNNNSVLK